MYATVFNEDLAAEELKLNFRIYCPEKIVAPNISQFDNNKPKIHNFTIKLSTLVQPLEASARNERYLESVMKFGHCIDLCRHFVGHAPWVPCSAVSMGFWWCFG